MGIVAASQPRKSPSRPGGDYAQEQTNRVVAAMVMTLLLTLSACAADNATTIALDDAVEETATPSPSASPSPSTSDGPTEEETPGLTGDQVDDLADSIFAMLERGDFDPEDVVFGDDVDHTANPTEAGDAGFQPRGDQVDPNAPNGLDGYLDTAQEVGLWYKTTPTTEAKQAREWLDQCFADYGLDESEMERALAGHGWLEMQFTSAVQILGTTYSGADGVEVMDSWRQADPGDVYWLFYDSEGNLIPCGTTRADCFNPNAVRFRKPREPVPPVDTPPGREIKVCVVSGPERGETVTIESRDFDDQIHTLDLDADVCQPEPDRPTPPPPPPPDFVCPTGYVPEVLNPESLDDCLKPAQSEDEQQNGDTGVRQDPDGSDHEASVPQGPTTDPSGSPIEEPSPRPEQGDSTPNQPGEQETASPSPAPEPTDGGYDSGGSDQGAAPEGSVQQPDGTVTEAPEPGDDGTPDPVETVPPEEGGGDEDDPADGVVDGP